MLSPTQQLITTLRHTRLIRSREAEALGVPRVYLQRLVQRGVLERVGRGVYALAEREAHAHDDLIETARRTPKGVICLVSALAFHELTTQIAFEVWIAIEGTSWKPTQDYPPLRVLRFSGAAFSQGIETHTLVGVPVRVYSVAKTVADCFKFRRKIGLDVALEALRQTLRERRTTRDELWQMAKVCRVSNVIKPYLEAMG